MINILDRQFDKLSKSIKKRYYNYSRRLRNYLKRLLLPIYLFPIKLLTYSIYYLIRFIIRFIISFIKIVLETIVFPFKSLKNLLKSIFVLALVAYIFASLFVIFDYIRTHYGYYDKLLCSGGTREKLRNSVVRVVGGNSEGSGFFIDNDQIVTNFHVILNEPSPKIILPDGRFITATKIIGDKDADLAIIYIDEQFPDMVFSIPARVKLYIDEPLISTGYPLGTSLKGPPTILRGDFIDFRTSKYASVAYIQTNITVVPGMSGGPLTDQCGNVVGINTLGLGGLSFFISADYINFLRPKFSDKDITTISVDPSISPEEAVRAFYTYLKTRRMQDGYDLLSSSYKVGASYEEWTGRFADVLDVDVIKSKKYENTQDTAFVKFSTKNWVDNEVEMHYYEGTWRTVLEDGVYKMQEANIVEVYNPPWLWFYE